jgi:hypothetical protein
MCCWQVHVGAPDAGAISYDGECGSLEKSVVSSPGYQGMLAIVSIFMYIIFHPASMCVWEREREWGLFFVYLLMWMCVQRWCIWLQGSLDRRSVLSKSFFILLYACLLFFKTCNSAASLSFSNFCVLVAVQFFFWLMQLQKCIHHVLTERASNPSLVAGFICRCQTWLMPKLLKLLNDIFRDIVETWCIDLSFTLEPAFQPPQCICADCISSNNTYGFQFWRALENPQLA